MSGSSLSAPGSINDSRTAAHLAVGQRLGKIDLSPLLVYTISGAPASALPFLAWQFDISSPFYALLTGNESQVQLIQQAIAIHRYHGTPYAIGAILNALGFPVTTILEGQASWGGSSWPADEGWAVFRVQVLKETGAQTTYPASWDVLTNLDTLSDIDALEEAGDLTPVAVTAMTEAIAVAAINFFKPTRSWLDSLWFVEPPIREPALTVTDFLTVVASNYIQERPLRVTDFVGAPGWAIADVKTISPFYNAHFYQAGITFGSGEPAVADSGIVINDVPQE
ncbi:MAG: phage tail protein [Stellaceae bacterium]